jgi:hypothetical protein
MRAAALVVGLALTAATILALCQAMLVPRKSKSITVRAFHKVVVGVLEAPLPLIRTYRMQDRWLSAVAPITVLLVLVAYVVVLMLTLGLVIYGVTDLSLSESLFHRSRCSNPVRP